MRARSRGWVAFVLGVGASVGCKSNPVGGAPDVANEPDVVAHREPRRLFVDAAVVSAAAVGAWAEYDVTIPGEASPMTMRVTLVARTSTAMDLEIATSANGVDRYIVEHVFFAPVGAMRWHAERATMRLAGGVDAAIPVGDLTTAFIGGAPFGTFVGAESLPTPVGTLKTKHIRASGARSGDLWLSDVVAPTGLVERDAPSAKLTLRATGG